MAEEPDDRLSELPDDLLQHILHLAPSREAVTTAVLSRRWRNLWPSPTGAVKIDIPSSGDNYYPYDASFRAAEKALAASHGPVERLAIDVGVGSNSKNYVGVVGRVLSHPASLGVQDVRIRAEISTCSDDDDSLRPLSDLGSFRFSFGSVPSAALRVLHMTSCCDLTPEPPPPTFACLEVLRLQRCIVALQRCSSPPCSSKTSVSAQHFSTTIILEVGISAIWHKASAAQGSPPSCY